MERVVLAPGTAWQNASERAAEVLRRGGIALLPAEGVYGLHALADHGGAVARLLGLKPRGAGKRFIGLIGEPGDLDRWAAPSPKALALAREHWPGALTLVVPASPSIPESLRAPEGTVALRCPGSPFLRAVVRAVGGIVLSTSANKSGDEPPVRAEDALADRVDLVVDQGELSGVPSTIVLVEGDRVHVLREGGVRLTGRST
ncbi:MAG: threonylcarbamoyl-AMP synthase [Candidatus Eisenbacteria bacterium]|uniref:L-threonylcarbamoyladenylate synthase n=1 Tax=Eiseniibacteriota bacterium TaxID=2212470 RepID=A0A538TD03_UNCEI|nr:MAG: threonylcarbamoyl-AMP synthase [Candidatus Eisenbacteria bacterium]